MKSIISKLIVAIAAVGLLAACDRSTLSGNTSPEMRSSALQEESKPAAQPEVHGEPIEYSEVPSEKVEPELELSEEEWKERLSDQEYEILRESGTEPAFSGELLKIKKEGVYVCAGCGKPLFSSETKFESGTGWPSFYEPIEDGTAGLVQDPSHGMTRVEVYCTNCGGHLGHVFNDGPAPTGLRYCMNSAAMEFEPANE